MIGSTYSFALRPEDHQPSGRADFSRIDNCTLQRILSCNSDENYNFEPIKFEYHRLYFTNLSAGYKRKYVNDFDELKEVVGWNDFKLLNNELEISNGLRLLSSSKNLKVYAQNYNVLRIMAGMGGGLAYSS
jgi:hypothetical protein